MTQKWKSALFKHVWVTFEAGIEFFQATNGVVSVTIALSHGPWPSTRSLACLLNAARPNRAFLHDFRLANDTTPSLFKAIVGQTIPNSPQ